MRTGAALNNQDRGKDRGVIATKRAAESVPSNAVAAAFEKRTTEDIESTEQIQDSESMMNKTMHTNRLGMLALLG